MRAHAKKAGAVLTFQAQSGDRQAAMFDSVPEALEGAARDVPPGRLGFVNWSRRDETRFIVEPAKGRAIVYKVEPGGLPRRANR